MEERKRECLDGQTCHVAAVTSTYVCSVRVTRPIDRPSDAKCEQQVNHDRHYWQRGGVIINQGCEKIIPIQGSRIIIVMAGHQADLI